MGNSESGTTTNNLSNNKNNKATQKQIDDDRHYHNTRMHKSSSVETIELSNPVVNEKTSKLVKNPSSFVTKQKSTRHDSSSYPETANIEDFEIAPKLRSNYIVHSSNNSTMQTHHSDTLIIMQRTSTNPTNSDNKRYDANRNKRT